MTKNIYSLIMAGGGGTRFWPLSRQNMPKQLLNLSGGDVMINETIKRAQSLINIENTFIITNKSQVEPLEKVLLKSVPRENILAEPLARNTAPCLLYSALYILETRGDGVICVFPADHYITNEQKFHEVLRHGIETAETRDSIVTIGIKPTYPSTGYGYIKIYEETNQGSYNQGFYNIELFAEKPGMEKAVEYIRDGGYYWNAGIFICKVSALIKLFKRFLPKMTSEFDKLKGSFCIKGKTSAELPLITEYDSSAPIKSTEISPLEIVYRNIEAVSIDYGIMERTDNALMIKGDFGWNDIGSWDTLGAVFPADENGNVVRGRHIGIDTSDCVIYGGETKVIATIGVKDLVVVDTGDALLICPKDRAQDVKNINIKELR